MKYPFALIFITSLMFGCSKPESCFNVANEKSSYAVGEKVKFISCSLDAKKYTWDFGDGEIKTNADAQITHSFSAPGNYTVTLKVTNGSNKDLISKNIAIK
jgi:PKD repeat protein